jgi:Flp pilus assembly protein TadD/uncharacterized caspase-like protein
MILTLVVFLPPVTPSDKRNVDGSASNTSLDIGVSYLNKSDYEMAVFHLSKAVQEDPGNWLPHHWLGTAYVYLRRYQDAITQLKEANRLKEAEGNYTWLGVAYFNLGRYEDAIPQFKEANRLKEEWSNFYWLGQSYINLGRYEDAITQFKEANRLKEAEGNYRGLGVAYFNIGRYQDAIVQFKEANRLEEDWSSYEGLGRCYAALSQFDSAEKALSRALELAKEPSQQSSIKLTLADCYIKRGDYKAAYDVLGQRSTLGVAIRDDKRGLIVEEAWKGWPADLAGVKKGDLLIEFNNISLKGKTTQEFVTNILPKTPFRSLANVKLQRENSTKEVQITVGIVPEMSESKTMTEQQESEKSVDATQVASKYEDQRTGQTINWAVVVGISSYKDKRIPPLRYASADAKAFYDWLVNSRGGGYPVSHVKLLLDKNATSAGIKDALFNWLGQAIEEDTVTIYFAGHGSPQSPDQQENLFLLTYDVDYSNIAATGFPMWDIETALKRFIKAKKIIVIADACHSGGVGRAYDIAHRSARGVKINPISSGLHNLSKVGSGVCIISASDDKQLSQEGKQWGGGHGVFTYFLLKGLKGEADYNKRGKVTLGELIPYLSENVRRATNSSQSPTVSGKFDPALTIGR